MLRAYLPPFIIAALISGGLTFYIKLLAEKFKLFDQPSPRKIHPYPIPRLGGVAIVLSFFIIVLGYILASHRLDFGTVRFWHFDQKMIGAIFGLLVILIVGVFDDVKGLSAKKKLFWQFLVACIVVGSGVSISFLRLPFGAHIDLNNLIIPINLGLIHFNIVFWADLISVFWLILMMNTFNFLDGLDGLATGIAMIAALAIFFLSISLFQDANALLAIIIAGLAFGFLPWNFNPAKIFLGDSGSLSLGYLIGVLSLISGGKLATSFLVLGIPVLDAGWVILRRLFRKTSPFLPDKQHFHHRLLTAGFTQKQAVIFLYIVSAAFGSVAIFSTTSEKVTALLLLLVLMVTLAIVLVVLELKKKLKRQSNG